MVSEEKDQYIEKLRRRNRRAWEKIQELEDNNVDFWQTIQKQQRLLEVIEAKLGEEKINFNKLLQDLSSLKNDEIIMLKILLLKEREARRRLIAGEIEENPQEFSNTELLPAVWLDSTRPESDKSENDLTSLEKLRATKGDANYFFQTDPRVTLANISSDQGWGSKSFEEEFFSRLLSSGSDLFGPSQNNAHGEAANIDQSQYDSQWKILNTQKEQEKLSVVEAENHHLKGLEGKTSIEEESESQDCNGLLKTVSTAREEELKFDANIIKKELDEARIELKEKAVISEESTSRIEQLTATLAEQRRQAVETSLVHQKKVSELSTLVEKVKAERSAQITSLQQEYQLEKQQLRRELDKLKQEFTWMKVSKMLTVNSVASELERLRKMQVYQPPKPPKTTARLQFIIPFSSFFT